MSHIPVLLNEVLEALKPSPGKFIIDGTTNGGGHLEAIISKIEAGKILAIDWDKDVLERTKARVLVPAKIDIRWANDNYAHIPKILERENFSKADGLLLDLGFSTEQLESLRGFSYADSDIDEPLDMRYQKYEADVDSGGNVRATASDVINSLREKELADIFWKYGEERFSRQIAKKILEERAGKSIITVKDLVAVIKSAVPRFFRKGERDVIARVFQALRIYVNDELGNIESILQDIPKVMGKGGRVAIISFHSLEDRLVKNRFKELEKEGVGKIITKKPIVPTTAEIKSNPASRSAKLRVIEIK